MSYVNSLINLNKGRRSHPNQFLKSSVLKIIENKERFNENTEVHIYGYL